MYNYFELLKELTPEEILEYLRKSRSDDPLLSVEEVLSKHETILDDFCMQHFGEKIPESNKYREVVSGESIDDRIAFQKILRQVESPKIKAVLVVELQRLGRPDLEEIGRITKIFRYTGTKVITPQRIYDLRNDDDRDSFERELKRGNEYLEYQKKIMNRGILLSVSQGNFLATRPPYGYEKDIIIVDKRKCHTLKIKEDEADIVRMIFNIYVNENVGTQVVANRLNDLNIKSPNGQKWRPDAIRSILENIHYIGKIRWNRRKRKYIVDNGEFRKTRPRNKGEDIIIAEGKHEAIISEELFYAAQEKRRLAHRTPANKELKNPFASIFFCKCGKAMSFNQRKYPSGEPRGEARFLCNGHVLCDTGTCSVSAIVDMVADVLKDKIAEFKLELDNSNDDSLTITLHDKQIAKLEKDLVDSEAREKEMWKRQSDPDPDEHMPSKVFKELMNELLAEREETKKALEHAIATRPTPIDYKKKIVTFQKALDALLNDNVPATEKNRLMKECIERMEYHRDKQPSGCRKDAPGKRRDTPIHLDIKLKI